MLQKFMDDFRESTGSALRLTSLAIAVAVLLFITTSFLCAAAFVLAISLMVQAARGSLVV